MNKAEVIKFIKQLDPNQVTQLEATLKSLGQDSVILLCKKLMQDKANAVAVPVFVKNVKNNNFDRVKTYIEGLSEADDEGTVITTTDILIATSKKKYKDVMLYWSAKSGLKPIKIAYDGISLLLLPFEDSALAIPYIPLNTDKYALAEPVMSTEEKLDEYSKIFKVKEGSLKKGLLYVERPAMFYKTKEGDWEFAKKTGLLNIKAE